MFQHIFHGTIVFTAYAVSSRLSKSTVGPVLNSTEPVQGVVIWLAAHSVSFGSSLTLLLFLISFFCYFRCTLLFLLMLLLAAFHTIRRRYMSNKINTPLIYFLLLYQEMGLWSWNFRFVFHQNQIYLRSFLRLEFCSWSFPHDGNEAECVVFSTEYSFFFDAPDSSVSVNEEETSQGKSST